METIGSVDLYFQCSLVQENRCFANQLSCRVHKHKEQEYADPISFDHDSIAEECVAEMEMHQEDTENPIQHSFGSNNKLGSDSFLSH